MKKFTLGFLLIFLVAVILPSVDCQRWNNGKSVSSSKSWKRGYADETNGRPPQPEAAASSKSNYDSVRFVNNLCSGNRNGYGSKRGGIGAWGYVAIALFLILSGLGIYYTIIFYPILCKKQRMYHVMGSTTV